MKEADREREKEKKMEEGICKEYIGRRKMVGRSAGIEREQEGIAGIWVRNRCMRAYMNKMGK